LFLTHFPPTPASKTVVTANWGKTLKYLHQANVVPFTFRKSFYAKLDRKTKYEVNDIAYNLFYVTSIGIQPHVNSRNLNVHPSETMSSALWKMCFLFEGAMMAPPSGNEPRNFQKALNSRIDQFRNGQFNLILRSALRFTTKPSYTVPSDTKRSEGIVEAANKDNWRKASSFLKDPLPSVPYNAENLPKIMHLHPPPTTYAPTIEIQRPTREFHHEVYHKSDPSVRTKASRFTPSSENPPETVPRHCIRSTGR